MAQAVLSVRMDEETKRAFADFCDQIGMSVSTAVNLFARQAVRDRRLPFTPSLGVPVDAGMAEVSETSVLDRAAITQVVQRAAEPFDAIESVVLFGSYARGDARSDSDIDLRIVRAPSGSLSLMNIAAFSEAVRSGTACSVDVVSARVIEDEGLAAAIEREGVVIYERSRH